MASRTMSAALLSAAALVGVTVAGCSSDSDAKPQTATTTHAEGVATTTPAVASNTSWNPCSLPDADIAAAGLNPAKRHTDTDKYAQKFPGWDVCSWDSDTWIGLQVFSTNAHTFDEVKSNTVLFSNPRPVDVGGRSAVMLDRTAIPDGCVILFDVPGNPVEFELNPKLSGNSTGDACTELTRIAEVLVKDLPSGR